MEKDIQPTFGSGRDRETAQPTHYVLHGQPTSMIWQIHNQKDNFIEKRGKSLIDLANKWLSLQAEYLFKKSDGE